MAINYLNTGIVIGVILLVIIGIWLLLRLIKKRKLTKLDGVPPEMLDIFNEAEKRIQKGGTANNGITPYQILWEIARERNRGAGTSRPEDTRTGVSNTGVRTTGSDSSAADGHLQGDRESVEARDFQLQSYLDSTEVEREPTEDKRKSKIDWNDFS
jgi:hypothetical protein